MTSARRLLRVAVALVVGLGAATQTPADITFDDLLNEGSLKFVPPEGFTELQPQANPVMFYERALRRPDAKLEIRYAVRPIARAQVEYEDPHNAAPDPNHLYAMLFRTMLDALADGGDVPLREYSTDEAKDKFNADWAAAAVFDVADDFGTDMDQGLLIAMHKEQRADAYVIFLYDDYAQVKSSITEHLTSLHFR